MILLWLVLASAVACAQSGAVEVWAVPSVYKVRPDERPQSSHLVWDGTSKTVSVAGAKNEHIPFQVVVSAPPPPSRYERAATGFFVEVSDLESSGARIPRDRVKLFFEHAILCYGKSSPAAETGFWPDALAPLTDPFGMAAEFRSAVRNRGIWVDVVTPAGIPAGDYAGKIRVTQGGKPVDELKLRVKVYDFALPEETHLITYMGVSARQLAQFHDVQPGSAEAKALLRKYHTFLYGSRMEPWFNKSLQPEIRVSGGEVTLHFDEQAYDLYLNQWRTKRVILETAPRELTSGGRGPNDQVRSYLRQVAEYYRKRGWLNRLVFNSPIDEPNTAQAFEETRRWATLVREAAPGVPFLVTKSPAGGRPEWGPLAGYANSFSVHGNELNRLAVKEAIRREQAKGGEITWYISCDQVYPQPNYFIDGPPMDPVMVPWITWRYGMQGILYWDLKYWSQTPDPWLDPVTYLSGFLCSRGGILNGEGSLLYPGSRTRRYTGQKDVDGPVSSIRLELLREGIEDYEYLWLLKSLGDARFADEAAAGMVVDVQAFSRNAEELAVVRERMARRIEQLAKPPSGSLAVKILDQNGAPTPARVYLTDRAGKAHFAPGSIAYDRTRPEASERHFVPQEGVFRVDLPAGDYTLEVERGKEFVPVRETVLVPAQGTVEKTVRLRRWVNMAALGWYSADMHPHRPLADMQALMEAEDLNVALPITRWRRGSREIEQDPQIDAFLAKSDAAGVYRAGKNRWFTVVNEELEPASSALLVSRLGRGGTSLEYPMADYGSAARKRGALVDSEKATSLELPVNAALGACDFVGLANNHFWRSGCYSSAWGVWPDLLPGRYPRTCAGFGLAGSDLYYALLNMGFPLKLSAGSAGGVHPVALGWSRIYVKPKGGFTPETWFEALKAGRSFVTTGPMLLLTVDGREPGEDFGGPPREVTARVRVLSQRPVSAVELVVNGLAEQVALSVVSGEKDTYSGSRRLRLDTSAWIAARWIEGGDIAHTSPIYYRVPGKPIPVPRQQVEYFVSRVEKLIADATDQSATSARTGITLEPAEVKEKTAARFKEALAVYRSKLKDAR